MISDDEVEIMLAGKTLGEVFNEFCMPILEEYAAEGGSGDMKEVGALFMMPMLIWNAVVLADECGDDTYINQYSQYMSQVPEEFQPLYDQLLIDNS